jgi:polyisoprenoid-binding protein YceI
LGRGIRRALAGPLLVLALAAVATAQPRAYAVDPARSHIRFHAVSRFVDADGAFRRFAGEVRLEPGRPETATGRIVVEVASIDTANRARDDHLRTPDFFDAAGHPQAVFALTAVRRESGQTVATGELTIRGVTRPLSVPVTVTVADDSVRAAGRFVVSRREFGIAYQGWLNPIRDEVAVSFDLTAVAR